MTLFFSVTQYDLKSDSLHGCYRRQRYAFHKHSARRSGNATNDRSGRATALYQYSRFCHIPKEDSTKPRVKS